MKSPAVQRTNADWVDSLRCKPADAAVATDLRDILARALAKALSGRGDIKDPDIEDFAQDAVIRIIEKVESFRGESKFTTWAIAVAIRVAHTHLRKRSWGTRSLEDLGIDVDDASSSRRAISDAAAISEHGELLTALHKAIEQDLTPRQRAAILGELAGMPCAVLAEQLETNTNALYKLHHDARKKLLVSLEDAGFSADAVRGTVEGASYH